MTIWFFAIGGAMCAMTTAMLVYFVMQSRHDVQLAQQRESLADLRATLEAQKQSLAGMLKSVEETTRRIALDQFLSDIRVEERHYVTEKRRFALTSRSLILRERIFFRNIPLSNWVEHEVPYKDGTDLEKLARNIAVFTPELIFDTQKKSVAKSNSSFAFD